MSHLLTRCLEEEDGTIIIYVHRWFRRCLSVEMGGCVLGCVRELGLAPPLPAAAGGPGITGSHLFSSWTVLMRPAGLRSWSGSGFLREAVQQQHEIWSCCLG